MSGAAPGKNLPGKPETLRGKSVFKESMEAVVSGSDAELMLRVKSGDEESFAHLLFKHRDPVIFAIFPSRIALGFAVRFWLSRSNAIDPNFGVYSRRSFEIAVLRFRSLHLEVISSRTDLDYVLLALGLRSDRFSALGHVRPCDRGQEHLRR